jgi:hypothetical protein
VRHNALEAVVKQVGMHAPFFSQVQLETSNVQTLTPTLATPDSRGYRVARRCSRLLWWLSYQIYTNLNLNLNLNNHSIRSYWGIYVQMDNKTGTKIRLVFT